MTNSTPQRWKNHTLSLPLIPAANLSVIYHLFLSLWPAVPATELLVKKQGYKTVIQELNYAKQTVLESERWGPLRRGGLSMS